MRNMSILGVYSIPVNSDVSCKSPVPVSRRCVLPEALGSFLYLKCLIPGKATAEINQQQIRKNAF
jgi:hypothetical protein